MCVCVYVCVCICNNVCSCEFYMHVASSQLSCLVKYCGIVDSQELNFCKGSSINFVVKWVITCGPELPSGGEYGLALVISVKL